MLIRQTKFYIRYVDDTLVLAKPEHFNMILENLNSFDKNLQFTMDTFADQHVHFLDIDIHKNETDMFFKPTHTGQYCNFTSQTPWRLKTALVSALYNRALKICSDATKFNKQVSKIKQFLSWNRYPLFVVRSLIKKCQDTTKRVSDESSDDIVKIFIKLPYLGSKGEHLLKSCIRKLKRYSKCNVQFVSLFRSNKFSMFCPTKDKIPVQQKIKRCLQN